MIPGASELSAQNSEHNRRSHQQRAKRIALGSVAKGTLFHLTALCLYLIAACIPDFAAAQVICQRPSCLPARDINGIRLDMTVKEVAAFFPNGLEALGVGQFQARNGDTEYNFGFSPRGRLFRIDSTQELGSFVPDRTFGATITQRLSKKFGPPQHNQLPDGPAFWTFLEQYPANGDLILNRETESLSAMLSGGYGQPISLVLKLMDFRILRRDGAMVNAVPQNDAQKRVRF
jgi:hypothetical protein